MMLYLRICLAIFLLWLGLLDLRADRYVVEPGTIGSAVSALPYNAWTNASTNIQWAVDAATNTETIWVSNGLYVLTNQVVVANTNILRSVNGPEVTIVNGNFAYGALETNRCLWLSNVAAFVHGFTFTNGARLADNGGGVYLYKGLLSNCYILNNRTFYSTNNNLGNGAGIYMANGTVTACRVAGNVASNLHTSGSQAYGGGIYATAAKILNCIISNNMVLTIGGTASGAGGVFLRSGEIKSSLICNNYVQAGPGGGIVIGVGASSAGTMDDCTVAANRGYIGGCKLVKGVITNCVFSNNTATASGYPDAVILNPLYNYDSATIYTTIIVNHTNDRPAALILDESAVGKGPTNLAANCTIRNNASVGVQISSTNSMLLNCVVTGNKRGVTLDKGTIRNCLIANNQTNGGVFIPTNCGVAWLSACTIARNLGTNAGAGLRLEPTAPTALSVSSCVIYSNGVSGTDDVFDAASVNAGALQYSCIGTNTGAHFTGAGIIVANPLFVSAAAENYRLSPASPCINAGSNENWMTNTVDLDGAIRIRYGTVDMGAYERIYEGTIYYGR